MEKIRIIMIVTLVWSLLMGANSIVFAFINNIHDSLFSLGCGTMSFISYNLQKNRVG